MTRNRYMTTSVNILRVSLVAAVLLTMGGTVKAQDAAESTGPTIRGNVYGGGNLADVGGSVTVNMKAGTVENDVYGGGALANTNINNVTGYGTESETISSTTTNTTTVNLLGGKIYGDTYGGGLGQLGDSPVEAKVYGDVNVNLGSDAEGTSATAFYINKYESEGHTSVVKSGRVFGCNNLNGSPQGDVTVTVWKTVKGNIERSETANKNSTDATYEVAAVYGGGNLANYNAAGKKTHVIINGCGETSIEYVYGGGNAAAVPQASVDVNGTYEIGYVFGGGNGKDDYTLNGTDWITNPGANVNGNTTTVLFGGTIHEAFGGSNEKGMISGTVSINTQSSDPPTGDDTSNYCALNLGKIYGAGKNADIEGDLIVVLGCMPGDENKTTEVYGGAENANVKGNVELTITSGSFGKVFGGNNQSGAIFGHVILNIEESGCTPIKIDELYLGGNEAPYSVYGYYQDETIEGTDKPKYLPITSADGTHTPVYFGDNDENDHTKAPYADPELNIISATYIGQVFGGGLGSKATVYGNPTVNINQTYPLQFASYNSETKTTTYRVKENSLGSIGGGYTEGSNVNEGGVFGGGNEAAVFGNTTINIGNKESIEWTVLVLDDNQKPVLNADGKPLTQTITTGDAINVKGANIAGNIYGGGNLANVGDFHLGKDEKEKTIDVIDVRGSTNVNICAVKGEEILDDQSLGTGRYSYTAVSLADVTIRGNVFGGGKGEAVSSGDDAFRCGKAMVTGSTSIAIGNGIIGTLDANNKLVEGTGNIYGGGEVGRVEEDAVVTIGFGDGTSSESAPVIRGNVFGAGAGVNTHGYAALLRGNTHVTVMGKAEVNHSVYGGGEIASVGRYTVAETEEEAAEHDVEIDEPYSLANPNSGNCYVTVGGYAEIGLDNMQMKAEGGPDDTGYVFGAGKGVLPYEGYTTDQTPYRVLPTGIEEYIEEKEDDYVKYIGTLALATQTYVTIKDYAFIKGSVYGGSENGRVQHDTDVTIQDHCQIGNGWDKTNGTGVNARYDESNFIDPTTASATDIEANAAILHECASWDYGVAEGGKMVYHPYDKYEAREGASTTGTDGHTFFGNVFGGGSGLYPYKSRKQGVGYEWIRTAGQVSGNTNVTITGGHILTSVYGGCELTDVGNSETLKEGKGKCTVKMSGGTLGVPRTLDQIASHPVTCYLFGAGKGDQRVHFNQWTNVGSVEVEISGGIIYGSVFGGGEDGHVLGDVQLTVKNDAKIGTWGTSYVDGNIFGGGRGFGGDALTAGVVSGNVNINIQGGQMLGSVYGGGRLGSVGTHLVPENDANYGKLIPDDREQVVGSTEYVAASGKTHGIITIGISDGTIGNNLEYVYPTNENMTDAEWTTWKNEKRIKQTEFGTSTAGRYDKNRLLHTKGGNVFAGAMGRLYGLDGETLLTQWADMGKARKTIVNISGGIIKSNVYGGGELGTLVEGTEITITGGTIGTEVKDASGNVKYLFGSVFGGGYGSDISDKNGRSIEESKSVTVRDHAGHVLGNTKIEMKAGSSNTGTVLGSIYGGGELAWVGGNTEVNVSAGKIGKNEVQGDSDPTPNYVKFGDYRMGNVYGGGKGSTDYHLAGIIKGNSNVTIEGGNIYHNIYGGGALGSVGTFTYDDTTNFPTECTEGTGTASVTVKGGTIGINGWDNGIVSGSSRGDIQDDKPAEGAYDIHDKLAWVNKSVVTVGTTDGTNSPMINCTVYGGGENGHNLGDTEVTVHSGTIGYDNNVDYECGNVFGSGCGTDVYDHAADAPIYHNPLGGIVKGTTSVTVDGGHVLSSVYGGGSMGSVEKKATVTISGGRIDENVYGGPEGDPAASGDPAHVAETEVSIEYDDTPTTDNGASTELIVGSVFGGGEAGVVDGSVKVNMKKGLVLKDVYGGGALADTQTSNWDAANNTWASGKTSSSSTTKVSLIGGTIIGDAYGGGLGRKAVAAKGTNPAVTAVEAMVYGDVLVELNNNNDGGEADESKKGCVVNRVFGCNNLNGTPKGKVKVFVYATQKSGEQTLADKAELNTGTYDVQAVYGGGNLAEFIPADALLDYATNQARVDAAYPEVVVDGCRLTSIKYVYGGGNAAPVPASSVEIRRAYEIYEVFGGGNGADDYSLEEHGETVWYKNPGANVGYYTYATYPKGDGQGAGTQADPYKAVENALYAGGEENKEARLAAADIQYGSGIAKLEVKGGYIHVSYGGSNSLGNVRAKLSSRYSAAFDDCDMQVEQSYGGGKNAWSDAETDMLADCAKGVKEMFGGARDADVNGDINLRITNGSSLERVFGGNNTSGAVNGSITITVEEGGCEPIRIGELYAGGFLAPYSVYGYEKNEDGSYKTAEVEYIDTDGQTKTHTQRIPLESGTRLFNDPRINVISATYIGNIFGGGYQAKLVGSPHINVNMEPGKILAHYVKDTEEDPFVGEHKDADNNVVYVGKGIAENGDGILETGTIGNIYGGGNMADIVGDTYVEIGTGKWVNLVKDNDGDYREVEETLTRNAATITGNVFGGGKGKADTFTCEKAMVGKEDQGFGSTNVIIGNGTVGTLLEDGTLKPGTGNVFGGGEIGRVEANTTVAIGLAGDETNEPIIRGNVFGAGAGVETHGYSALVRGNSTVTVQGKTKVGGSVYGGGQIATVGKYKIEHDLPSETTGGGLCTVTVQDKAEITGNVFGAGQGITPAYNQADYKNFKSMVNAVNKPSGDEKDTWDYYVDEYGQKDESLVWKYYKTEADYLKFLQTLALASNTVVTIDGSAQVKKNVYGGSESGFVQNHTQVNTQGSSVIGTQTISGDDVTYSDGNIFGGGKGLATFAEAGLVKGTTTLNITDGTIYGNVYGGGELGAVGKYTVSDDMRTFTWGNPYNNTGVCNVTIAGGTIGSGVAMSDDGTYANGNVFGAGKGLQDTFWCEKAIVYKANVNINAGRVKGNVYGGGEVGRVETDAEVKIGPDSGTSTPVVEGSVFGGGAGVKTHGYSALVRGNTYVTVQSSAQVGHNVYGGGQIAAVGKYYLVTDDNQTEHPGLSVGMPYSLVDDGLGICYVTIKGDAEITGSIFGGGKGKVPENLDYTKPQGAAASDYHTTSYDIDAHMPKRMMNDYARKNTYWEYFGPSTNNIIWEYFDTEDKYLTFLETLGLTTQSVVAVEGGQVNGNVYGGSESGFVQHNTSVTIAGGEIGTESAGGNVFGGGLGLATFAEAGRVRGNTTVNVNAGTVKGNVYGGGQLGDVGTIVKNADYNYKWTDEANPGETYNWNNTGVCNVTVKGGTIGTGVEPGDDGTYANGNVFGAGKGLEDTWWCEKAIAYKTNVTITDGTINGTVYGGGQVGRVEKDATVTIGTANETGTGSKPNIIGNVFGAGAGIKTHGYSALVRGDAYVTVQGIAQVGHSVYGGGEIASVGRFTVVGGLPKHPDSGGTCTVTIQDHAKIGADGTGHNVFGACKGVNPAHIVTADRKSMQLLSNAPENEELWDHYNNDETSPFIWRYYPDETDYLDFLETLALTSHPVVTIAGDAIVNGSVFGGGERGITLGSVEVNMNGGTVTEDVYGGGSLANTNKGNWETSTNTWAEGKTSASYTTAVNLHNGTINGTVYGGGLGDANTAALVYGDVEVKLNETIASDNCVVKGYIFGCNNVNGTPKGHVKVHVFKTADSANSVKDSETPVANRTTYDVAAVFGGGKSADYVPEDTKQSTEVIIEGCDLTSIKDVYGGGYGASTPGTNVLVKGTYIIDNVFGGGYGAGSSDPADPDYNPGANVGYRSDGTTSYGLEDSGKAVVQLMAGTVNNVYGGSNTKGDIRGGSDVTNVTNDGGDGCCSSLTVQEIYGGGKSADMYGGAEICLSCMPNDWIGAIYAGAEKANVGNDVSLTLTSGKFERVFGGNKSGGTIEGYIEVNIEENPECGTPIIIGGLYGGGNEAPYTVPARYTENNPNYQSPRLNVRAFTSIGNIYGGGFGANATVTGNPMVNINVVEGGRAYDGETRTLADGSKVTLYARSADGKMGVIGNVFGGGNAASVIGKTYVNIGTQEYEQLNNIIAGVTDVTGYYTRSGEGTAESPYAYTKVEPVEPETTVIADALTVYYKPVVGADIRGNVYGGGNNAEVTGNTNVVIGAMAQ